MKKLIILILTAFCSTIISYSQNIERAPLNPDYIKWLESSSMKPVNAGEGREIPSGLIPPPHKMNTNLLSKTKKDGIMADPPASYDLRDYGRLTSVKNQGDCGSCWTFASFGSMESTALTFGLGTYDGSEQNMKNCHGYLLGHCSGGNEEMATAYLTRRTTPSYNGSPLLETDDGYNILVSACSAGHTPMISITEAWFLPVNDDDLIKNLIMEYGALFSGMYFDGPYFNSTYNTYYYSGAADPNHGVTLVGWDDNKSIPGAPGNGAWIIKNSWGSGWGENGYFYVSYYDSKINYSLALWPDAGYYYSDAELYHYDELGYIGSIGYGSNTGYGLAKFTASGTQALTKISSFVPGAGAQLEIRVYDTFQGGSLSDELASITGITCDYAGYYTFDLSEYIELCTGDDFYVMIRYNTPSHNFPIPAEYDYTDYSDADIESGVCWISSNGSVWTPIGTGTGIEYDLCIRAYAKTYKNGQTLEDVIVRQGETEAHLSTSTITAAGSSSTYYIDGNGSAGGNVTMTAYTRINLKPGFTVKNGSSFHAFIDGSPCGGSPRISKEDRDVQNSTFVNIYPNPSDGIFTLEVNGTNDYSLEIFDILGSSVYKRKYSNNPSCEINLSGMPSGVYIMKLRTMDKLHIRNLLLSR